MNDSILEGDTIDIMCKLSGSLSSNITYQWYFIEKHKYEEVAIKDDRSWHLLVTASSYMNDGVYRCDVSDGQVATHASAEVTVTCKYVISHTIIHTV